MDLDKPAENVLVIMSDEHQARALGCAGHSTVKTPNLDRLAAGGVRFDRCWTPSPICVPARASFATGRWVHDVGAWDSAQAYAGEPRSWMHAMRDAGRDVVSFGKLHHRAASDDDGFTERHLPMFTAGGIGWVQGLLRRDPLPYPEAAELAGETGIGDTSYTRYDRKVTERACEWIHDRTAAAPDQPWVAFVSFVSPHYPLSAPEEFTDLYPRRDVPPPEIAPIPPTNPAVDAIRSFFDYGSAFDDETLIDARRAYFALCSFMDHNVGRVLSALDETGQRSRTRIIYTSDHGELLGNRGLWCKSFLYRDSVTVPMIISGPGLPSGVTRNDAVNLIDIAPTILDTAGLPMDGPGESLWATERTDRPAFTEYHDGGSITGSYSVVFDNWKYVHHEGFAPELFDLDADPDELVDLAPSPNATSVLEQGYECLRSIVDPTTANGEAFASQEVLIAKLGGREGIADSFRFNHTPAPDEEP